MQLSIAPDAIDFLKAQHNGELTLRTSPRHGCCGGTVMLPVLEPGAPPAAQDWPVFKQDGLVIYIEPGVDLPPGAAVRIGIDRFFKWHRLWIEGLEAQI
jgi:hypothetical protein